MKTHTYIIASNYAEDFNNRVNTLTAKGWQIIPESLKIAIATTSNAWSSDAQTERSFVAILKFEK